MTEKTPVFITSFNQLIWLRPMVENLLASGVAEPIIVDNASVYSPLLEWFDTEPCRVIRRATNDGPGATWLTPECDEIIRSSYYVVTDSDLELDTVDLPAAFADMRAALDKWSQLTKAGLSLRLDDLPDTKVANEARGWESQFWTEKTTEPDGFFAAIDTTFAMYRAGSDRGGFGPAWRSGHSCRHLPWYLEGANDEIRGMLEKMKLNYTMWSSWWAKNMRIEKPFHELRIITPCTRPENLQTIYESIVVAMQGMRWKWKWLVLLNYSEVPQNSLPQSEAVELSLCQQPHKSWGGWQRTEAIRRLAEQEYSGWVYFLDDDNLLPPSWAEMITDAIESRPNARVIIGSREVSRGKIHPPSGWGPSRIDTGQVLVHSDLIKGMRWGDEYDADGHFWGAVCDKHRRKVATVGSWVCTHNSIDWLSPTDKPKRQGQPSPQNQHPSPGKIAVEVTPGSNGMRTITVRFACSDVEQAQQAWLAIVGRDGYRRKIEFGPDSFADGIATVTAEIRVAHGRDAIEFTEEGRPMTRITLPG